MKVELEAKNIIIDGIDVFDHIGKVEKVEELNQLVQLKNKLITELKTTYNNDYYYKYNGKFLKSEIVKDLLKMIEGIEEK